MMHCAIVKCSTNSIIRHLQFDMNYLSFKTKIKKSSVLYKFFTIRYSDILRKEEQRDLN